MAGNLMLLAAMTLHARHVILDAEGLLPRRSRSRTTNWPRRSRPTKSSSASSAGDAVEEDRPAARHAAAGVSAGGTSAAASSASSRRSIPVVPRPVAS